MLLFWGGEITIAVGKAAGRRWAEKWSMISASPVAETPIPMLERLFDGIDTRRSTNRRRGRNTVNQLGKKALILTWSSWSCYPRH